MQVLRHDEQRSFAGIAEDPRFEGLHQQAPAHRWLEIARPLSHPKGLGEDRHRDIL